MKAHLLIVLMVVVLGTGSALAVMNNACESSRHAGVLQFPTFGIMQKLGKAKMG